MRLIRRRIGSVGRGGYAFQLSNLAMERMRLNVDQREAGQTAWFILLKIRHVE